MPGVFQVGDRVAYSYTKDCLDPDSERVEGEGVVIREEANGLGDWFLVSQDDGRRRLIGVNEMHVVGSTR